MTLRWKLTTALAALALAPAAWAQTYDSGSTGALGDLVVDQNIEVPLPPDGVLDYASLTVNSNRKVTFKRNTDNTPVIIRVQGDVVINGTVDVSGTHGTQNTPGIGYSALGGLAGPGGGDGGSCDAINGTSSGGGIGPGGGKGNVNGPGGGGASPITDGTDGYSTNKGLGGKKYADWQKQQLFGGSGGGCGVGAQPGAGGGGAITIASSGTITVNGYIYARGGQAMNNGGAGGGGVIRLVAAEINGNGTLDVRGSDGTACASSTTSRRGGCGGDGLIKLETWAISGNIPVYAQPGTALYYGKPQPAVPGGAARPTVEIVSVVGASGGTQSAGDPDWTVHPHQQTPAIFLDDGQQVTVNVATANVEPGKTVRVRFNILGQQNYTEANTQPLSGTFASATASASLVLASNARLLTIEAWVLDVAVPQD